MSSNLVIRISVFPGRQAIVLKRARDLSSQSALSSRERTFSEIFTSNRLSNPYKTNIGKDLCARSIVISSLPHSLMIFRLLILALFKSVVGNQLVGVGYLSSMLLYICINGFSATLPDFSAVYCMLSKGQSLSNQLLGVSS